MSARSNAAPRGMIVLDKIRLTGRLLNFFISSEKTRSSSLFFPNQQVTLCKSKSLTCIPTGRYGVFN